MMMKNIIIIVSAMNLGGAQRVVTILCDYWSKKGYIVTLISTYTGDKANHYPANKDVHLKFLSNSPILAGNKFINLSWKLVSLRRIIKNINPDVTISFLTRVNIASAISTIGLKTSLVLCERTWTPFASLNHRFFWLYKILFINISKIIVQTDKSKTWMEEYFPNSTVEVIPNPIEYPLPLDSERSIEPNSLIAPNNKIILASGRLHKYKQFDILINAFSNIYKDYNEWCLVILGDGEEKESLRRLISDLKINERVLLPGSVGNVSEWYERADLFVLCSKVEGFPNVLLESMSYGLPCISFDCDTGPRDMIEHEVNGLLVNPEEKELGLIKALTKMINNDDLRNDFSSKSILLRDKYAVKNIMQVWDKALKL
tara:strand:- start:2843 stop:3958 length:1116 start_codon:yes stop_codon:yes gene_type:complete